MGEPGRPTIALLRGLGMAHRMWQPQFEDLAAHFYVLGPDLPGLCGSKDWANLPAARDLARGIAGAEMRVSEGAGHVWNLQRPREFSEVVSGFVGRVEATHNN